MVWGFNAHLESNEEKIIDNISFLNDRSVSFKDAHISLVHNFPFATIVLNSVEVFDFVQTKDRSSILKADKITAKLSLRNWRDKTLHINHITITGADVQILKDKNGFSNLNHLFPQKSNEGERQKNKKNISINTKDLKLSLLKSKFQFIDSVKTTHIDVFANFLHAQIDQSESFLSSVVDMDLNIKELTFKEANGSYLTDSHLTGKFNARFQDQLIEIPQCSLYINQDQYLFSAHIPTRDNSSIKLKIENKHVELQKTLRLLTPKLRTTLSPYKVRGLFPATANILLKSGNPARVDVDFHMENNTLEIENLIFTNLKTTGRFINRKDDNNKSIASGGNFLLTLDELNTDLNSVNISSDQIRITAIKYQRARIGFQAFVTGPSSAISEWYESERFFFEGGQFVLNTNIDSPINDVKDILLQSSAELFLKDVSVLYKPSKTKMPVHELNLHKDVGAATFYIKSSTLVRQHNYRLDGILQNLSALLVDFANESATSELIFTASTLSWSDFISIFSLTKSEDQISVSDKETKRNMKQTLKGIHKKFKPSLNIHIDTFNYFDIISLYNLKTGATFTNENTLQLIETEFNLDQGSVNLNTTLDLEKDHETTFSFELQSRDINIEELLPAFDYFNIDLLKTQSTYPDDLNLDININGRVNDESGLIANTAAGTVHFNSQHLDDFKGTIEFKPNRNEDGIISKLTIEGNPILFNDFFKNDKFIFQDTGRFSSTFDFEGNVTSFDHLLKESTVDLIIKDGAVHNLDVDVIFPLNDLELTLNQDTATFNLYMYSDYIDRELNLTGELENLSELLFANTGKKLRTKVTATSPLINLSHAVDIFETTPDTTGIQQKNKIDNKIKQLTKDMLNRFNPLLNIELDTFVINNQITLHDLSTGVDMLDSSLLVLKETDFTFFKSKIKLNAEFDISNIEEAPFTAYLETDELDLEEVLFAFNYFGSETMRNADILKGKLTMDIDLKSSISGIELIENKTKAIIDIELENLELKGIDVIDKVAAKLFAKQLLEDIKFAPLTNTITVTGSQIEIPQMEIQSTGIDLFVEGYVDNKKETNVWLSVPLDNIKRKPTDDIPAKRGYAATKRKVYLEITSNSEQEIQTKFRLRKKKFYKQRGITDQFREDKKRYKIIRKNRKKKQQE